MIAAAELERYANHNLDRQEPTDSGDLPPCRARGGQYRHSKQLVETASDAVLCHCCRCFHGMAALCSVPPFLCVAQPHVLHPPGHDGAQIRERSGHEDAEVRVLRLVILVRCVGLFACLVLSGTGGHW